MDAYDTADASETTGTFRAISGATVPVTTNSENAGRSVAVARGKCSGLSTPNKVGSAASTTFGDGGASANRVVVFRASSHRRQPGESGQPKNRLAFLKSAHRSSKLRMLADVSVIDSTKTSP
jgi:hypothetical protein